MPTPTHLIIESPESAYEIRKGTLGNETLGINRGNDRPPYSGVWYETGDGGFDSATMELKVRISAGTLRQSIHELNELMEVAEQATLVRWGEYHREVFGLVTPFVKTPIALGYRLTLAFACKSTKWLDEFGNEVYL